MKMNIYQIIIYNDELPDQIASRVTVDSHPASSKEEARDFGNKLSRQIFGHYTKTSVHVIWVATKEMD